MTASDTAGSQAQVRIVVMNGDGIGPEITAATLHVLHAVDRLIDLGLTFEEMPIGLAALRSHGTTLPDPSFAAASEADGVILGPVSHNDYPPVAEGGVNPSGELRKRLDLYANIRPARSRPGFPPRCGKPVDLVIVRENTEGFYADRSMYFGLGEIMPTPDLALSLRKITRAGSTRIAEAAFRLAALRRNKVTAVHKANVLRISDGLFLEVAQAQHGSAPDIAGRDLANPSSLIGSAAMLLAWLGERRRRDRLAKAAELIDRALDEVIAHPQGRTADLGGPLGTKAFGERVAASVVELAGTRFA